MHFNRAILVGAREGRDAIKKEIGIEIEQSLQSAGIYNKLRVRKDKVPIRPLTEGKLEYHMPHETLWY
ncbi:MAG: hypothetical protein JO327_03950 [Nitrososphaeraceae archaeon]|nr:hypothetical protein [Nitrososphaeraceae archaeon]